MAGLYERALGHRLVDLEVLWVDFKRFADCTPWRNLVPEVETIGGGEGGTATPGKANNVEVR